MTPHRPAFLQRRAAVHRILLAWYRRRGRTLPWRNVRDPYRILLSEFMLQQTQVSRVLEKYPIFLKKFPSLRILAISPVSGVIRAWRGMGYNNRAVRIHALAQTVVREHRGRLPQDVPALEALPGIGPYTARAIACFAFGIPVPVVDTNVRRVLARLFPREFSRLGEWQTAAALLPRRNAFDWNQGLMDFGARVCTARNPQCHACPLARQCPSAHRVEPRVRGVSKPEPSRNGVPNRVYRGRIVDVLRNGRHHSMHSIGKAVKPGFGAKDQRWLKRVLQKLEQDGLLRMGPRNSVRPPGR